MTLEETVGKTISDFCKCGYTDAATNHCAHFVCHFLKLDFDMTCKKLTGSSQAGANVRVQELFKRCPTVGWLSNWSGTGRALVFVTAKGNVDLATKTMKNVPKKHVGILEGGFIYHYGNTLDKVRKQTVAEFKATFDATYGANQGYYFGTIPALAPQPVIPTAPTVQHEIRDVNGVSKIFATVDGGAEFLVGRRVRYGTRFGIGQGSSDLHGGRYDPQAYTGDFGQWAWLVYAIGKSESDNYFNRINSYDRAAFTFGFFQLAAHTPNDNLILYLRRAMAIEEFRRFFPEFLLQNGKLHRKSGDLIIDLEEQKYDASVDEYQLKNLMNYLNPSSAALDKQEIVHAAKLVELCRRSGEFRRLQVETAVRITKHKMRERYHGWYNLSGKSDALCLVIADIHHQGRATKAAVKAALASSTPLDALTRLGESNHPERCRSLREMVTKLTEEGKLGRHRFESAHGDFVP